TLNLNSNASGGGLGANGNTTNTFRGNVVLMAGNGGVALGAGNGAANAMTRLVIDGVLSGATSTLFINGSGAIQFTKNNTYTGIIDSLGANRALTKIGPGTLIIGGAAVANTFQGGVFVNGGILSVQNTSATPLGLLAGPSGGLVTVNNTGTLRVETGVTVPNP